MTAKSCSRELRVNGDRRAIGITEITEFILAKMVPGVTMIKDGSQDNSGISTDVFVRRYQLPPQVIQEVVIEGPVISFVYNRREGWASIDIPRRDIKQIDSGVFGDLVRGIWNTKLEVRDGQN